MYEVAGYGENFFNMNCKVYVKLCIFNLECLDIKYGAYYYLRSLVSIYRSFEVVEIWVKLGILCVRCDD